MTHHPWGIGSVVLAKAGRDKGKAFLIVGTLGEEYVLIANGTSRSIDKPKKKKRLHLDIKPQQVPEIQEKIQNGRKVFDAEIKKRLKSLGYDR